MHGKKVVLVQPVLLEFEGGVVIHAGWRNDSYLKLQLLQDAMTEGDA